MPLTPDDREFLKAIYQKLQDKPLKPGDPLYQPIYDHPGCDDPVSELQNRIEYAETESMSLFSGFRGSGKTTELFRLRSRLQDAGYIVLYADALEYINPAMPVDISSLLITLAGAFGEAAKRVGVPMVSEGYWERLRNWFSKTDVKIKEVGLDAGADIKLELRTTPTFRQKLAEALSTRLVELHGDVKAFFEEGIKAIREFRPNAKVVFLFDSLEQIRGSISNEQEVTRSIELLFSNYPKLLEIPSVHVVYTVPPWLKFALRGLNILVLPCLRLWNNDQKRTACGHGPLALRSLVERRFPAGGLERLFGPDPWSSAGRLTDLCGGHFRDLLLLLRETVLRADSLPVTDQAIDYAILRVKSNFLPIALDDALWLAEIEKERATVLKSRGPVDVNRLTLFLDSHIVLYIRNGEEWYDVHPLVRDEVAKIAKANAADGSQ